MNVFQNNMRRLLLISILIFAGGCASNTSENPNLQTPIDSTKAEIVGSKVAGEGGIPWQIYASYVDGKQLRHVAIDQTLKIWPIDPGEHEFRVEFIGSYGTVFKKTFTAESRVRAELEAGHRYIVRIRAISEGQIVFYFEDAASGKEVFSSEPVKATGIPTLIFIPL